jgi:hypothetical protein
VVSAECPPNVGTLREFKASHHQQKIIPCCSDARCFWKARNDADVPQLYPVKTEISPRRENCDSFEWGGISLWFGHRVSPFATWLPNKLRSLVTQIQWNALLYIQYPAAAGDAKSIEWIYKSSSVAKLFVPEKTWQILSDQTSETRAIRVIFVVGKYCAVKIEPHEILRGALGRIRMLIAHRFEHDIPAVRPP